MTATSVLAVSFAPVAWRCARSPRAWAAGEAPVAFWSWRQEAPTEEEVARAASLTRARTLFLRAGQFDFEGETVRRIRPVGGRFPRTLEIHLVYNATRALLAEFERIGEVALATAIVETYLKDRAHDGVRVAGLQLDFDVPTRLLARYGRVLRATRGLLPRGTKLSVTGLPTWMNSAELGATLDAVDFWVPQCYGAEIPGRLDERVPIASAQQVGRAVARARALGKPFYAGLSAYGYALLYGSEGALIAMRGDLDPARVARDPNFELIERTPFTRETLETAGGGRRGANGLSGNAGRALVASEWRYVYRARENGAIGDLSVRAGDSLVIDMPSSASLRACARGVRQQAGGMLLGICLFRLPGRGDHTTLTVEQIGAALADAEAEMAANISVGHSPGETEKDALSNHLSVRVTNRGTANALLGDGALALTLRVPRGSLRGITGLDGFTSVETLCESGGRETGDEALRPCGLRRADALRLTSPVWGAGSSVGASLSFEAVPRTLNASVAAHLDDGRVYKQDEVISLGSGGGR